MIKVTANLMAILLIHPSKYHNDIYLEYLNVKLFMPKEQKSSDF